MKSCTIYSVFDNKPSKTHQSLLDYYGDTPSGINKANEEYQRLTNPEFLEKFHGENEKFWFNLEDGDNFDRSRFTEQFEPQLIKDRTGRLYYENYNGSRTDLVGKPLAWLSNTAQKQFIDSIIFSAIGGEIDLTSKDFEDELVLNVDTVLENNKEWFEANNATNIDLEYIKYKVQQIMESKKLKLSDSVEIEQDKYDDLDQENTEELEDDSRTSNSVVRVESYLKNSKDTASANIKLILSFIPNFTYNEEGNYVNVPSKLSEETGTNETTYKDPHELWRKIEDVLSDLFTEVDSSGKVISVIDKMMAKLEILAEKDASIDYLLGYLENFDLNKKIQFAQAFHKHDILFSTTDVSGSENSYVYKVIDPSVASSKNYKIRQSWNDLLMVSPFLKQSINDLGIVSYQLNKKTLTDNITKLSLALTELNGKKKLNFGELSEDVILLNEALKNIGIDTNQLTEEHYQEMFNQYKEDLGKEVAPSTFLSKMFNEVIVATRVLNNTSETAFMSNTGFKNPLLTSDIHKRISDSLITVSDLIGESTVMIAGGKTAWKKSLPSYLDIALAKFKSGLYTTTDNYGNDIVRNKYVEELQASSEYYNHPWLDQLHDPQIVKNLKVSVFSAFQKQGSSKYGKDNKNILFPDQLVDKITKTLLPRIEENTKAIHYTPAAADKGRLNQISGFDIFNVNIDIVEGLPIISNRDLTSTSAINVLADNFISEYLRAKNAYQIALNTKDTSDMVVHYDLKNIDGEYTAVNADGIPVGNSIQTQSLPELSPYKFTDRKFADIDFLINDSNSALKKLLYAYDGNKVDFLLTDFDIDIDGVNVKQLLREYLADKVDNRIKEAIKKIENTNIVNKNKDGVYINLKLDSRLWKSYADKYSLMEDKAQASANALYELVADYTLNGMVSNIGYNKLFAGDIAYYSDVVDYNKRIPGTYTDGKYLMIDSTEDLNFNIAVTHKIEISATDISNLRSNFIDSINEQIKLMDSDTKKIYTKSYINALADTYANQYTNVNAADAQAWISLDRWKFIKEKLGEFSPKAEEAFKRLKNNTFTYEDLKFAAQPLKGVYFDKDNKTGIPTYLKYSQAVLIPSLVKGTELEYMVNAMKTNKVDEVITLDGVKVGALSPTKIHDIEGNLLENMKLNSYKLSNLNWKLQQQLPVKGMKNNMDIGSQLQKNIVSNIFIEGDYLSRKGQEVINDMNRVVSDLTLMAFNETINSLGLDPEGRIENKDKFYDTLAKLAIDKGVPTSTVEALNRGYEIDAIPQLRYKLQNIISASFNNNIAKNSSPGGSFIQISNIGITNQDIVNNKDTDIYMLQDIDKLERPKMTIGEDGRAKVSSGQVFLPHSFIAKYIPNYAELSKEDLLKLVDKELFKIIGYRIPNQKLSSNQPLEVVGILPESMGDSIMMYSEITTQTGSDFDIDKTYVMLPAFNVEYADKKDLVDTLFKMKDSELLDLRTDIEDYKNYIKEHPLPSEKINNSGSNKRQLINYLVDRGLIPAALSEKYATRLSYVKPGQTKKIISNVKPASERLSKTYPEISIYNNSGYFSTDDNQYKLNTKLLQELADLKLSGKTTTPIKNWSEDELGKLNENTRFYLEEFELASMPLEISEWLEKNDNFGDMLIKAYGYSDIDVYSELNLQQFAKDILEKNVILVDNAQTDIFTDPSNYEITQEINVQSKKQLQNQLFEIYFDVLSSPLSFVDMMSGIDGSIVKDEINRLHGKKEDLTSLQLLDPTYQLQVKFDNIVGKSGVGLTANQMVDHVYTQMAGQTMDNSRVASILKEYIYTNKNNIDLSQIFDKEGNKITDSVSMFLNAYVDIAKDPYITKGNFNSYTSNATFFLLRTGLPIKHVVSFIGQPILKDLIANYESTLSSLPSNVNKRQTLTEASDSVLYELNDKVNNIKNNLKSNSNLKNVLNELERVLYSTRTQDEDYGISSQFNSKTTLDDTILNQSKIENFMNFLTGNSDDILDRFEKEPDALIEQINELANYIITQQYSLSHFLTIHSAGEQLSEQVLVSKADVNGGGHDIATHFSNNNRHNKVMQEGIFSNLDKKFDPNTMLGSKTLYTMKYFSLLDENLFITMDPMIKPIYPMITKILKGDQYATNTELVKTIEKSLYASLSQIALQNSPYEIKKEDIISILNDETGIINRINSAKLNSKYDDNKLIQALEVIKEVEYNEEMREVVSSQRFLSVDNFTRKPDNIIDDLNDGWDELLNSNDNIDKKLAIDLVKYAIFTSGLSKNRHSIFEFMPLDVTDHMNRGIKRIKDTGIADVFDRFIEDFMRHNQNSDYRAKASIAELTAGVRGVKAEDINLSGIDKRIKLVEKTFEKNQNVSLEKKQDALDVQFKIDSYKLFMDKGQLMRYVGDIKSLDGRGDLMVLAPTYSLGKEIGNGNIYEYTSNTSTAFTSNGPKNYKSIQAGIKQIKETLDFEEHSFDLSKTLMYYGKGIQMTEYDPKKARKELIKRGLVKENKC